MFSFFVFAVSFHLLFLTCLLYSTLGPVPAILKCFVNKVGLDFPSWENETALEIMSQTVFDDISRAT